MALSRVVCEIFNVEKYRELEIRVRGHLSEWSFVPNVVVQIPKFDAKPNPNPNPNPSHNL